MSIRWFGGPGQSPGICEIPLATFQPALQRLSELHEHVAVVGTSKGAEAALLLAGRDVRIRAVAALSPSSVVWANVGPGSDGAQQPYRSSWSEHGQPLPFVPYDDSWMPADNDGPPVYRTLYEQSLVTFAARTAEAAIPVEHIRADLLVSAGGDDQLWPSDLFAEQIVQRRAAYQLSTRIVTHPGAGHRVRLPSEPEPSPAGTTRAHGGNALADTQQGKAVWEQLVDLLHLDS